MARSAEDSHRTKGLLRLTMACNERCPFCNVPVEDFLPSPAPPEDEIRRALHAFVASGEQTLTLTGGEPTLRRRLLVETVERARSLGVPLVELQTNAILIDGDYAAQLAGAGLTSAFVSLLSDRAELHDRLAGLPGAFERCLRGVDALLGVGVRVALNPVIAAITQERVPEYVDFVAERLPGVRSISLSAVQPHGRAARDPELMPDYAVLAPAVREARQRAARHGIELLNPYCGLPACVGWADDLARSVEAVEAELAEAGGTAGAWGVENEGNKRHGPPCRRCALRTRCGGAWHAYWALRGGSGLHPVQPLDFGRLPSDGAVLQERIDAEGGPTGETWRALAAARAPTVWLRTDRLDRAAAAALLRSRCTDLVLRHDLSDREVLAAARRIARAEGADRRAIRLWLEVEAEHARAAWRALELASALPAHAVRLPARWAALLFEARRRLPHLDVTADAGMG